MEKVVELAFCIVLLLLVVYFIQIWASPNLRIQISKGEGLSDIKPKDMSISDLNMLITAIERSIATKQLYGDFRHMYPYDLSPWQFFKLISLRKKGKLTIPVVQHVLGTDGAVIPGTPTSTGSSSQ
jgi:hypothetical protein